jgi:predicted nucleotidyltransferase
MMNPRLAALEEICRQFEVDILYLFGSRADEVAGWFEAADGRLSNSSSDIDVGVKPLPGVTFTLDDKINLAIALEDLLDAPRVDLIYLPDADPFLAANVIRGERLYCQDDYRADEYDLYVLRRAGDLAYHERERIAFVLRERP